MTVGCHVGGDEHPLGELIIFEILIEQGRVLDLGKTVWCVADRVVEDLGVVLAHIVVCSSLLVDPGESLIARVRHILLVQTPANSLVLEEINNGGDVCWNLGEWVTVKTEIITVSESVIGSNSLDLNIPSNSSHIIRLTGMSYGEKV